MFVPVKLKSHARLLHIKVSVFTALSTAWREMCPRLQPAIPPFPCAAYRMPAANDSPASGAMSEHANCVCMSFPYGEHTPALEVVSVEYELGRHYRYQQRSEYVASVSK
jgi:hypothetical protein